MIYYKTNKNWFGDVRHLAKSWTMVKIMRSVLIMAVYATIVCAVIEMWLKIDTEKVPINTTIFSLLGLSSVFYWFFAPIRLMIAGGKRASSGAP
jgi:putative membrane protein